MATLANQIAIGTRSLGQHETHDLDNKIQVASQHGFSGVEIVYADLETYSKKKDSSILEGAQAIRRLCESLNVYILALAPFENYEGSRSPQEERLRKAEHWFEVARVLGAEYLQVPAQFGSECTVDEDVIVSDLRALADLGAAKQPVVAIAYEPMSWSVHVSTWETTLRIIKAVDRENFGLCLDSFHILTKLWGSPYEKSGKYPNADENLTRSLHDFKTKFPLEKLFYVQLSDGEKFDPPFSSSHPWYLEGEAAEFTWSKHARPFPGETEYGAYLPVAQFLQDCVVDTGFKGWISMEIFDRRMRDSSYGIRDAAQRGRKSWDRLRSEVSPSASKL